MQTEHDCDCVMSALFSSPRHMIGRCNGGALGQKKKEKKSWQTLKSGGAAGAQGVCAGETEVGQFVVVAVLKKYPFKLIINEVIIETKSCEKKSIWLSSSGRSVLENNQILIKECT